MFHFSVFKVNVDGSYSDRLNLNTEELDVFLTECEYAAVLVVRNDSKAILYAHNGVVLEPVRKFIMEDSRLVP